MSGGLLFSRISTNISEGIYFDDIYLECHTCWFRVCLSCSPHHQGHVLQRVKSIRDVQIMPELNTSANCACCTSRVKLGWHCTRCGFAICLTCHLAPGSDDWLLLRTRTSMLFTDHLMEHLKFSPTAPLMVCVRGILFFLRGLPNATRGCRCVNDPNLANHCGTCYIRKLTYTH
jgi:hypothetical protein